MAVQTSDKQKRKRESPTGDSTLLLVLRYVLVAVLNGLALILIYAFLAQGIYSLAVVIFGAAALSNIVSFTPGLAPLRWMVPGFVFIILLLIYPMVYTFYTSFTNYGDGHLLTKQETINRIETGRENKFVPEDALTYEWTLMVQEGTDDEYALWLARRAVDGSIETAFAPLDGPIIDDTGVNSMEAPEAYENYVQVPRTQFARSLPVVQNLIFGEGDDTAGIRTGREAGRPLENRLVYDAEQDAFIDQIDGTVYVANDEEGLFQAQTGSEVLQPGYRVNVGTFNYERFFSDPQLRGPLITIFIWTVVFALLSVLTTFTLGLFVALVMYDAFIPGKKIIQSLLIIPYAIPGVISILVWQGMLNFNYGIFNRWLGSFYLEPQRYEQTAIMQDGDEYGLYVWDNNEDGDVIALFAPDDGRVVNLGVVARDMDASEYTVSEYQSYTRVAEGSINEALNAVAADEIVIDGRQTYVFGQGRDTLTIFNENSDAVRAERPRWGIPWPWEAEGVNWLNERGWARAAIILVNLWLGYPYMMLICSGALTSIPSDIYEAAAVDGASPVQRFWQITLPLLLITVGPLLIASFVFNFNNFLLIEALTAGAPPFETSPTPAGYTDILISYVYRLAFGNNRGADYGYASAISILIFVLTVGITLVQFRFTRVWEEVGENV